MADSTPTLEQVYAAVVGELNAMSPLPGVIYHYENYLDEEQELIEKVQHHDASAECKLLLVSCPSIEEVEDGAVGENYSVFHMRVRLVHVISMDPQWSRIAQRIAERVRTQLNKNQNVFAIGGQRQLLTPETVQLEELGQKPVGEGGTMTYQANLLFQVEARRWS